MNWTVRPEAQEGDLRHVTRFLWTPLVIGKQTRWMELASWIELRQRGAFGELVWVAQTWRELPADAADGKGFRSLYRRLFSNNQTRKIVP